MNAQIVFIKEWTPEVLLFLWAFAQSLILEYVPYVKEWYHGLEPRWKRFSQAIGLGLMAAFIMLLACTNILGGISCDEVGVVNVIVVWILALAANQGTHSIFKKDGS